ncbi:hypothetical protein ATCC90586_010783 [Pythium insidiosum]|nr:hypothetical protein ATCC90586_010783 [Pythium insidiosum]
MLELKAFVQETVHALEDTQLRLLSETLRVDVRGCDNRADIERIVTGLLCLDQDTSLGTFLTWLRTRDTSRSSLVAKKTTFANTFVPTVSPRRGAASPPRSPAPHQLEPSAPLGNQINDHHLNEEISQRLQELRLLERDFKDAERSVHSGVPSFEKLKAFLLKLTRLRSMEEEVRRFFIRQSELLTERHDQMKAETLHTRSQLDFFVDGFTNLRHRHDELLEKSTQMKAENEALQETLLAMTANESHFAEILHRTLLVQLQEKEELQRQLRGAREHIDQLQGKQRELEKLISRLKQERGDAQKDAACYKRQLQRVKKKAQLAASDDPDAVYFRQQATQLRAMLQSFFTLFRESIVRDTKSAKQAVTAKPKPTPDRRAAFAAMPFLYSQLEPVQFPEERVEQVLDVLERQRQRHATPFVQWDDTTRELNETLAMWAEEVHMMVWVEQENRRPKKPDEDASAPSSRASNAPTAGLSSSSSRTATSTSSRTGTRAAAKPAGGASPTRGRGTTPSRSSSPSRAAAAGPSKRASAPSVSPKRNSSVSPPKRSVTKPAAPSPPKTSPGKPTKSASSPSRRK